MRERHQLPLPSHRLKTGAAFLLFSLLLVQFMPETRAESLFRASAVHQQQAPTPSRSLFAPPISRQVGDIVTIEINERSLMNTQAELKITREQAIQRDNADTVNSTIRFFLDKLPFGSRQTSDLLSVPSMAGTGTSNIFNSKAQGMRQRQLQDRITCQVVQVLPNGDLVVQGHKTVMMNKEREELMVTGIVRPYYLDRNNTISSEMVANFQMLQGGKGVISRQQNDGVINKLYQFFN